MPCSCMQAEVRRERCTCCREPSPVGFTVPDKVWEAVVGRKDVDVYCIRCFAAKADALNVQWSDNIEFWPVSAVTARE